MKGETSEDKVSCSTDGVGGKSAWSAPFLEGEKRIAGDVVGLHQFCLCVRAGIILLSSGVDTFPTRHLRSVRSLGGVQHCENRCFPVPKLGLP